MLIGVLVAAIIIAYFIFMPELEALHIALFFSFWFLSFFLDAWITISNRHLIARYEQNVLLPILMQRYGTIPSVTIMFVTEVTLMLVIPMVFLTLIFEAIAVSALAFGSAHILAFISNLKFIKSKRRAEQL